MTNKSFSLEEMEHFTEDGDAMNNNNSGGSGADYVPYSDRPETYIIPIIFVIIFLVGVLGNGTLVLIFMRHRNMRNVPNTYILSLALGDLLVILSCVPFTSTVYTVDSWPYGQLVCKISESTKDVSIGVSVFTLTALSADRFFAIVDPLKKLHSSIGGRRATRFTAVITCTIWTMAFICAVPAAVLSYIRVFQVDNTTSFEVCYPYPDFLGPMYPRTVILAKFLLYYAIPLCIIAFFYILMARHLIRSTQNMPGEAQGQARQIRARKKVAKTVLAFVVVFAVCFFPQHVFLLWFYNHPTAQEDYNSFWHIFRMIGFVLAFTNSCINPIALYCVSGTFRKYFDMYLFAWCKNRKKSRKRFRSNFNATSHTVPLGMKRADRTFYESTTTPPAFQLSTTRKQETTTAAECTTVTTLLNGIDIKNHVIR